MPDSKEAICARIEDDIFDVSDVRAILREMVYEIGTQAAFCQKHGVDRPNLSNILAGKEGPYGRFLDILGMRAVTVYVYKQDQRFSSTPTKRRPDAQERHRVARSIEASKRAAAIRKV